MSDNGGPRTQLWKEEYEIIAGFAASVPDDGLIVEIGTAEGGTSFLMHRTVEGKHIQIYTVDIAPSPRAFEYLKNTGVNIITQSSEGFAKNWKQTIDRPIDFLFIDGNHDLEHLIGDWNLWIPFVKLGGTVAFHDYDPIERGGIAHLAVRVGVETILRSNILKNPVHKYKLASGIVQSSKNTFITANKCYETLTSIGKKIVRIRDADYSSVCIVADDDLALLLKGCLHAKDGFEIISLDKVHDPNKKYLVHAQPNSPVLKTLSDIKIPDSNITTLDSLTVCYLIANALKSNYTYFMENTRSLKEYLIWAEALSMFDHAFGESLFPDSVPGLSSDLDIHQLSQFVAREQVRVILLSRLLRTFIEWVP